MKKYLIIPIMCILFLVHCPVPREYGIENCKKQGESGTIVSLLQAQNALDQNEKQYWTDQAIGIYLLSTACKDTVK